MRSMELVGRERMEVAVSFARDSIFCKATLTGNNSNNSQFGVRHVTMMSRMLPTSLVS